MLKSAYTGAGLTVGHTPETDEEEEGYYLSSGWWVLWFNAGMFPKEAKAAVIELCGELPAVGEVFKAEKDFGNQYEIEQKEIFNLPEAFKRCTIDYRVTNIMQQQGKTLIRILQAEEGRNVCAVSEVFLDLIDLKSIDYENGETEPFGPCAISPEAPFVYWGMIVAILWQEEELRTGKQKRSSGSTLKAQR